MGKTVDSLTNKLILIENLENEKKFDEGDKLFYTIEESELGTETKFRFLLLKMRILRRNNDYKELFEVSKNLKELCSTQSSKEKLEVIISFAISLWRLGKLEESISELEAIKESSILKGEENSILISDYFHTLGTIYWASGKFDLALENFQISLPIREKNGNLIEIAKTLNNIGIVFSMLGNNDNALKNFEKSLKIKKKLKETDSVAKTLNNIGHIHLKIGNTKKALRFMLESLRLRENLGNQFEIATSNSTLGILYFENGEYDLALKYYQKGLEIFQELEIEQEIAYSLNNIGITYFKKGNLKFAEDYLIRSQDFIIKSGNEHNIAELLENLGLMNRLKGNITNSLNYFMQSLEYRKKIGNLSITANSLENIGYTMTLLEKYSEAIETYEECLELRRCVDNKQYTGLTLFHMISFYYNYLENSNLEESVELDTKKKIESFLKQLKNIESSSENKGIKIQYQLAKCLKIIHSEDKKKYSQAKIELSLIIKDRNASYQNKVLASINLCYLHFYEYTEKGQKRDLKKINTLINKVLEFADKQQITDTNLLFKVLKAKLAIYEYQIGDALVVLEGIKKQAQELGYKLIESKCNLEIERINERNILDHVLKKSKPDKESLVCNSEVFDFLKELAINLQQSNIREK